MVAYTVTSDDVFSVDLESRLVAGVVFDYDLQEIQIPPSVSFIDGQWLVDHARFVESTTIGSIRPTIVNPYGKYVKGIDPITGLDVLAGIEVILLDNWLLVTNKTSGSFIAQDIFKPDGSYPIKNNPLVQLQYKTSQGLSLVQLASGGGFTTADRNHLNSIPTNPLLATDNRLDNLDATISSRLASATYIDPANTQIELIRKFVTNRYKINTATNKGILYDDDGETPILIHHLMDHSGHSASSNVYERMPE